jgi:DNA polymerase-3 subunit gamma/tau
VHGILLARRSPEVPSVIATDQHQAIYRRWRAQTFAQVIGQDAVVTALRNAIRDRRLAHALLFAGPRGTGKTSVARIVAKALNCPNATDGEPCDRCPSCVAIREGRALDVVELDAASNRGIDEVRSLRERLAYAPADLPRKVYILDEAHQITKDAWNALLKSIEEPPDFVTFIFASTHPQGFPAAILSRLQRYDFRRLTVAEIAGKLETILAAEGRAADGEAVRLIAELAAGGMRDAETILDQLLATGREAIRVDDVRDLLGLADPETVEGLVRALVGGDAVAGIALLDDLEERGRDLRTVLDQVVDRLRRVLLDEVARGGDPSALVEVARRLAAIDPTAASPGGLRLQIELAFLAGPAVVGAAGVSARGAGPAPVTAPPAAAGRAGRDSTVTPPAAPRADDSPDRRAVAGVQPSVPVSDRPPSDRTVPAARKAGSASASRASTPIASPPSPAPPGPTTAAGPATDIDEVLRRWPEIVAHLSRRPPLRPLMVECRPIQVEGSTVVLGFPEDKAFLRDVAERRRLEIEEGMAAVLERAVAVRCVATNLDGYPPLTLDPEGARLLAEAKRIFGDDLVEVREIT